MFFKELGLDFDEGFNLQNSLDFLKKATRVYCLSATFGGPSCKDQLQKIFNCKFVAECNLTDGDYDNCSRVCVNKSGRKKLLEELAGQAK